jgi:hypothetical protein
LVDSHELEQLQSSVQGASRERMLREMVEAAELFAVRRSLVVVLEDLHWSDVSTLDWLTSIACRRDPAKLLLIGTYRPTDMLVSGHPLRGVVRELQARGKCRELRMTPLAERAVEQYLAGRFAGGTTGWSPLRKMARLLYQRTEGSPLFLVHTIDYLVRQGAVREEAGQWTIQEDKVKEAGECIPDTVRQLIEHQVERLSEAEQRLLEVASVAGAHFAAAEVAAGLGTDSESVEARCEWLARTRQFLRAEGIAEWPDGTLSGRYGFLHALHHEVVYARLAEVRRIHLHRRIAERKEAAYGERAGEIAAELAMHFEGGREFQRSLASPGRAGENTAYCRAHPGLFRQEGDYWTLAFAGKMCRVRHTLGMRYLAQLLRHPRQEFPVLALAADGTELFMSAGTSARPIANDHQHNESGHSLQVGLSDAGELLDAQAKAAYKRRLRELHEELDEAQAFNDLGRADRVQAEIDFLTAEITRAVGLGGRPRKTTSPVERARVNVTLAIKTALKHIRTHHPSLGHYLTRTIKTGYGCVYTPEPASLPSWQF